jgi:CO/xanthine dehydrogenase FAD-binding subunit
MVEAFFPKTIPEAVEIKSLQGAIPFAGGTDLMVRFRSWSGLPPSIPKPALFLSGIPELVEFHLERDRLSIGACVALATLLDAPAVPAILRAAIARMASPAVRSRATIGGNLCNASPAADTVPPLVVLDAMAVIAGKAGERAVPVAEFATGPGKTVLAEDEILVRIEFSLPPTDTAFSYRKVGTRRANALSKLSSAALWRIDDGKLADFRIAFGAVAPTVVRLPEAEALLVGRDSEGIAEVLPATLEAYARALSPIDDQRSSAEYRKAVALRLIESILTKEAIPS